MNCVSVKLKNRDGVIKLNEDCLIPCYEVGESMQEMNCLVVRDKKVDPSCVYFAKINSMLRLIRKRIKNKKSNILVLLETFSWTSEYTF